ncbi:MAG: aspartate aminotransferase family protein [Oligoflexia bacterium]|nr:aspartate aminotransferase family protein [Oligoflexia bacterium]
MKLTNPMPPCDYTPTPYKGISKQEALKLRKQYLNPAIFHIYKEPLMLVDGYMQYLFDETGRRYLDLLAGIVTISVGHCHPRVIEKTKAQIDRIQHSTTIYLHPLIGQLAEKLATKMPKGLEVTYFVNSGSEANDLAITMARLYTGNWDVLALENCYHGAIYSCMGLTSHHTWKFPIAHGDGVHHVANPDPYRTLFEGPPEATVGKSIEALKNTIKYSTPGKVAAFIAEPIQGVGGTTSAPKDYFRQAYEAVRSHGGLCIADEVQTGFGRTGDNYWGFQNFDVVPDIVTMAKGIGNGIPLAAVTTRREIAEVLAQRIHFNTFGGNPVSMAQGLATLEVIDEENLQANSKKVGTHLLNGLKKLQASHSLIGDVRGQGLMLGMELVKDRKTREPAKAETLELLEVTREMGVLLGKGGLNGNVLRIKPPMCITTADADFAIEVMDQALKSIKG